MSRIKTMSPEGTAELSPGRSPGVAMRNRKVPQGRLKGYRDMGGGLGISIADYFDMEVPWDCLRVTSVVPTGLVVFRISTQDYVLG
jgi:hypothetical protein